MGSARFCDGCGERESNGNALATKGIINKLDYCPKCSRAVDEFTRARDELHTRIMHDWDAGLDALRQKAEVEYPGLKLPDA